MIDYPPPQVPVAQQSQPSDPLRDAIVSIAQRLALCGRSRSAPRRSPAFAPVMRRC